MLFALWCKTSAYTLHFHCWEDCLPVKANCKYFHIWWCQGFCVGFYCLHSPIPLRSGFFCSYASSKQRFFLTFRARGTKLHLTFASYCNTFAPIYCDICIEEAVLRELVLRILWDKISKYIYTQGNINTYMNPDRPYPPTWSPISHIIPITSLRSGNDLTLPSQVFLLSLPQNSILTWYQCLSW